MGIYDRDYYRQHSSYHRDDVFGGGGGGGPSSITQRLIIANAIVFFVQLFSQSGGQLRPFSLGVTPHLWLDPLRPWEIWRLVTAGFCHDTRDLMHLLVNMYVLWWTGSAMERRYGRREFLGFYLTAEVMSSAAYLAFCAVTRSPNPAVGASGAVMATFVLYAFHYPRSIVLLFFVIPIEIRYLCALYAIWDLYPMLLSLSGRAIHTGVAHAGHAGGMLFGCVYFMGHLSTTSWLDGLPRWRWPRWLRRKPPPGPRGPSRFELIEPTPRDEAEREVDRILAKISAAGEESLTAAERATLEEASRRYREKDNRR